MGSGEIPITSFKQEHKNNTAKKIETKQEDITNLSWGSTFKIHSVKISYSRNMELLTNVEPIKMSNYYVSGAMNFEKFIFDTIETNKEKLLNGDGIYDIEDLKIIPTSVTFSDYKCSKDSQWTAFSDTIAKVIPFDTYGEYLGKVIGYYQNQTKEGKGVTLNNLTISIYTAQREYSDKEKEINKKEKDEKNLIAMIRDNKDTLLKEKNSLINDITKYTKKIKAFEIIIESRLNELSLQDPGSLNVENKYFDFSENKVDDINGYLKFLKIKGTKKTNKVDDGFKEEKCETDDELKKLIALKEVACSKKEEAEAKREGIIKLLDKIGHVDMDY